MTEERKRQVIIVAPVGADAANAGRVLHEAGIAVKIASDIQAAAAAIEAGAGALLLTEEAIDARHAQGLCRVFNEQPPWSDLPVVLITSGGQPSGSVEADIPVVAPRSRPTLIERPLRIATLVAAVQAALRARERQYEIRDLLEEREQMLDSLETRVAERTHKLREMVQEMEAFSYSVSHDLRGPLRMLAGYAQALQEDCNASLDPRARQYAQRIGAAAEQMDRLTRDLLAYTRISGGAMPLEPISLDHLLADVIERYPSLNEARDSIRVQRPLGTVLGHAPSLVQCFSNLLENALKFTPPPKQPQVTVSSHLEGNRLRVTVSDNGVGVPPELQSRIFDIFERAAPNEFPGTGIGLAIVKRAVERMGGSVGVISALGEGAQFWLDFPAVA